MKPIRTMRMMLGVALTAGFALAANAQFNMARLASLSLVNGAEINAYDATTKRLFVVSGKTSFDVVSLADPANPRLERTVDLAASNAAIDGLNSVSVKNGVAVFAAGNTDKTQAGFVVFVATAGNNTVLNTLSAGALPDMVTFSPDGNTVLVANEGEPTDAGVNPEGSVTLIDLAGKQVFSLTQADATQLSLAGFNGQKAALEARGVRMVFPNATVAQAIEPEYIAVTPDNTTAFIACQENNAYLVVDIAGKAITDILPLGFKDHSRGPAKLAQHIFSNLPDLGLSTVGNTNIALGGLSGLWHAADESFGTEAVFYATPDRGPNGDVVNGKRQFLIPTYQARIVRFTLNTESGALAITDQKLLTRAELAQPFFTESFEAAPGTTYTLSGAFDDGGFDYFGRYASPDNANGARDDFQSGFDGSFAIHGQDHDGDGNPATQTVSIANIDISGKSGLSVSGLFGALNSEPNFNNYEAAANDGIKIYATIDGGSRALVGQFSPKGSASDLYVDSDFNGEGDGAALTTTLKQHAFQIAGTGTSLKIEIEITTTDSFEPIVVDKIQVATGGFGPSLPITGLPNVPGFDEVPVDGQNNEVAYDPYGADLEGIIKAPDNTFWTCDEYRPSVYHFKNSGELIARYVPAGTHTLGTNAANQSVGDFGQETLPAVYSKRRANRGFEAIALDTDRNVVYAFIQTPMDNPDSSARHSDVIRILGLNPTNGTPISEYVYFLERNRDSGHGLSRVDKLGDAVYAGNNQFYVIERDSSTPNDGFTGKKYVFKIDLTAATNIRAASFTATNNIADVMTGATLETMTADQIVATGIRPVYKRKVLNLPSIGYLPSDKPEGIALVKGGIGDGAFPSTPKWGSIHTMWDMLTVNEGGSNAGRYLYRAHEIPSGAGVSRSDTRTGETVTLFEGNNASAGAGDTTLANWANDYGALDPVFWTPWNTILTGEEWSGPGRLIEITNPEADAGSINAVVRAAIPFVSHEGLETDQQGALYFGDEDNSGSIYKFVPTTWGDLSSGQSYVLVVDGFQPAGGDASKTYNDPVNAGKPRTGAATWVPVSNAAGDGPAAGITVNPFAYDSIDPANSLHGQRPGRIAADQVNAAPYGRPEDFEMGRLANGNQVLYIAATSENTVYGIELQGGTTARVFVAADQNTPNAATLAPVGGDFARVDNLAIDAEGNIYVIEDNSPGDIWIMVDPDGDGVANQVKLWASLATPGSEPTGLYLNPLKPDEAFVNVQHPNTGNDITMRLQLSHTETTVVGLLTGVQRGELPEDAPFKLAPGLSQSLLATQFAINAAADESAPDTPVFGAGRTMWDMLTVNETGTNAGKYLYRAHESETGAGVSRTDLGTGKTVTLFGGDATAGNRSNTDFNAWANDYGAIDPVFWTPWGTVLSGEEWSGLGRLMEITNPEADPASINNVVRTAIPYVSHEGLEVDGAGALYYVDEDHSGSIYKFVPTTWGDLSAGRSFVLKVTGFDGDAAKNWNDPANDGKARTGAATWVPITNADGTDKAAGMTNNPFSYAGTDVNVRFSSRRPGRLAADEVGGAPYGRPEDIEMGRLANGNEVLYFCATSEQTVYAVELKADGSAMVKIAANRDTVNSATTAPVGAALASPDNLAIDHKGRIYVIEDQNPGDIWLLIDPDQDGVANQMALWASLATPGSEPTGLYINPLKPNEAFVNVQHPSTGNDVTMKITLSDADSVTMVGLPASVASGSLPEDAPFSLSAGLTQSVLESHMMITNSTPESDPTAPQWGSSHTMWDMLTVNETGPNAGKYLYRAHESPTGAGVSRTELATGETVTLFEGDQAATAFDDKTEANWANDYGAIDPVFWTPWGTVLSGEEWAGLGRLMEITNPEADPASINNVVRTAIPLVSHEGLEVDAAGALYYVDEDHSGSIYKFVPTTWGDLSAGQSFVLKVGAFDGDAAKNWNDPANDGKARTGTATWVPITNADGTDKAAGMTVSPFSYAGTDTSAAFSARRPGRLAADEVGGAPYGRPEDIEMGRLANGNQVLYFCATSEQTVYAIELKADGSALVKVAANRSTVNSATSAPVGTALASPDNLAIDHQGRIYVIEDQNPGDIWLLIDPDQDGVANQMALWASLATPGSEPTGLYINPLKPDEAYVNVQHPSTGNDMTVKITMSRVTPTVVNPLPTSVTPGAADQPEHNPFKTSASIATTEVFSSMMKRGGLDAFGNPVDYLAVLNDNDFAGEGFPTVSLGLIGFGKGNRFDASNRDGKNGDLKNHPTLGMYQPDSIAFYTGRDNETYLVSANEGDAADYDFYSEEARVKDLTLDSARFPTAGDLQKDENLGRLKTTTANGDLDGDGDTDVIYSYGARSFTIWDKYGNAVYDSSDKLEIITKLQAPHLFNANDGSPSEIDARSDDKGPEPEALTIGTFGTNTLVFVGMERSSGGIAVADVSNPRDVKYLGYFYQDGDIAPEGLTYIPAANSPSGKALLIVSYEVSNNVVVYELAAERSRLISEAQAHRLFAHAKFDLGEGPFSYQWRKDGVAIVGATGATYDPTVGGAYDVLITDGNGNLVASETFNLASAKQVRVGGVKIEGPTTGVTFRIEAVDALGNVVSWQTVNAAGDLGDGRFIDFDSADQNIKFFRVIPVAQP